MKTIKLRFNPRPLISDDVARKLTASFLDGSTTPDEEKTLYAYYGDGKVADDLECYQPMFAWYVKLEREAAPMRSRSHRPRFVAAAAAAVIILVGAGLFAGFYVMSYETSDNRLYAGSYIIRDGNKITDIDAILPELHKADRYVDSTLCAINCPVPENPEQSIINEAVRHITDPDIKTMLLADLN